MTFTFSILLIVALVLWVGFAGGALTLHESDPAGNALSNAYTSIIGMVLWVVLAALLLVASKRGEWPGWAAIAAWILVPTSGVTAIAVIQSMSRDGSRGKILVVIPIIAPFLLLGYASWQFFPSLRSMAYGGTANVIVWSSLLAVSVLPWPVMMQFSRESKARIAQQRIAHTMEKTREDSEEKAKELAKWLPKFEALTNEDSLYKWREFTGHGEDLREKAFAGMRVLKNRQKEAEEMLEAGSNWPLIEAANLDLEATPVFCERSRKLIRRQTAQIVPPVPGRPYDWEKQSVDPYLPALEWLLTHGCPCKEELAVMENAVSAYPAATGRNQTLATLARLRKLGAL